MGRTQPDIGAVEPAVLKEAAGMGVRPGVIQAARRSRGRACAVSPARRGYCDPPPPTLALPPVALPLVASPPVAEPPPEPPTVAFPPVALPLVALPPVAEPPPPTEALPPAALPLVALPPVAV